MYKNDLYHDIYDTNVVNLGASNVFTAIIPHTRKYHFKDIYLESIKT